MDRHQAENLDLYLRATAAVLNGMYGPPAELRPKTRIVADIWSMVGVDYYRVNPTSKTHRMGFDLVKFAFDLASLIAGDRIRDFSHSSYDKASLQEQGQARAVMGILARLYPADQIKSVSKLQALIRHRSSSNL